MLQAVMNVAPLMMDSQKLLCSIEESVMRLGQGLSLCQVFGIFDNLIEYRLVFLKLVLL